MLAAMSGFRIIVSDQAVFDCVPGLMSWKPIQVLRCSGVSDETAVTQFMSS